MRQSAFRPRLSATILIVIINVVAFLAQSVLNRIWPNAEYFGALSVQGLRSGYVWQLLTFQLMHSGFMHLFWNCLAIWMFGRAVEDAMGHRNFYVLYFASGIAGGLLQVIAGMLAPLAFGGAVVGASAGAFGITAAFALLFPESTLLLFFIIPMPAKYLLILSSVVAVGGILSALDIIGGANYFGLHVAHAAHLGGMLAAVIYVRYGMRWTMPWDRWVSRRTKREPRRLVKVHSQKAGGWSKAAGQEELSPEEFLSREVDPILDKISAQGIQSLTERERKILEAARSRVKR